MKKIKLIVFFLLIILTVFLLSEKFIPKVLNEPIGEVSYLNKITGDNIEDDIKKVITEYMDLYYRSIKELKLYNMDHLFANDNVAFKNREAIDFLIETRKLQKNDLKLSEANYDLDIKVKGNNQYIVLENSYIKFAFMDSVSNVYNIENNFTIEQINGEYKITDFDKVQDFFVIMDDPTLKDKHLDQIKKRLVKEEQAYQDYLNDKIKPLSCDHSIDRKKALEYALKYVTIRNESEWASYEGSNCQNYASQVLYAAGIPLDYVGSEQWGAYNRLTETGTLNTTWTYVPYFANYVKNNTGYGLCARYDENLYYAEAGDIIHVGTSGPTRHSLVVVGSIKKDGKVSEIIVNSNTIDLENYPLSAYVYPYVSLIKVYGWND